MPIITSDKTNEPELTTDHFQFTGQPTQVSVSGSTARTSSALDTGWYWLRADVAVYFRQGDNSVDATTSDYEAAAGERIWFYVDSSSSNGYIAGLSKSGVSGTLEIGP